MLFPYNINEEIKSFSEGATVCVVCLGFLQGLRFLPTSHRWGELGVYLVLSPSERGCT